MALSGNGPGSLRSRFVIERHETLLNSSPAQGVTADLRWPASCFCIARERHEHYGETPARRGSSAPSPANDRDAPFSDRRLRRRWNNRLAQRRGLGILRRDPPAAPRLAEPAGMRGAGLLHGLLHDARAALPPRDRRAEDL